MAFCETSNHVRKLKLFIPTSQAPLLTTYGKIILPKLSPLKQKFQILSKRTQTSKIINPQIQYLSATDIDKLNRSYQAFKKAKGTDIKSKLKQTQYHLDPYYKNIHNLRQKAQKSRVNSQRRSSIGSSMELSFKSSLVNSKN